MAPCARSCSNAGSVIEDIDGLAEFFALPIEQVGRADEETS